MTPIKDVINCRHIQRVVAAASVSRVRIDRVGAVQAQQIEVVTAPVRHVALVVQTDEAVRSTGTCQVENVRVVVAACAEAAAAGSILSRPRGKWRGLGPGGVDLVRGRRSE